MNVVQCRRCGANIVWLVMAGSGKRMPVNAVPASIGTIVLDGEGRGRVDTAPGRAKFVTHFATCTNRPPRVTSTPRKRRSYR